MQEGRVLSPAGPATDSTIYVLNVLWFKPGGAERYGDYLAASRPIVEAFGGEFLEPFVAVEAWEGEIDADLIFYGRYPSRDALLAMLASDEYRAIFHIRQEAVERAMTSICTAARTPAS
ncbi:MAG: DUF1330 domain-containing protein [Acidimicrobiales bacterium]